MHKSEIIKVSLEIEFGNSPKHSLKDFINKALDNDEYYDGFEIAISKKDLDYKEYDELYQAFIAAYSKDIPDIKTIRKIFDENLPQSYFTQTSWLVSDAGEIYATDGLRIVKIYNNKRIWLTERVSYDGIELTGLSATELSGHWYNPMLDYNPWCELKISTADGGLIKGEVIKY